MIVCVCHAVPESALVEAARAGMSREDIVRATRAGTGCGCCRDTVAEVVASAHRCGGDGRGGCAGCPRRRSAPVEALVAEARREAA